MSDPDLNNFVESPMDLLRAGNFEKAKRLFEELFEQESSLENYYGLRDAILAGKHTYNCSEEIRLRLRSVLDQAIKRPEASPGLFLEREQAEESWDETGRERRVSILLEGRKRFPNDPRLLLRLADLYIYSNKSDQALSLLKPHLTELNPPPLSLWLAAAAYGQQGEWKQRNALLDKLGKLGFIKSSILNLMKGDSCLSADEYSESISFYEQALSDTDMEVRIRAYIGEGLARLKTGELEQGFQDIDSAIQIMLEADIWPIDDTVIVGIEEDREYYCFKANVCTLGESLKQISFPPDLGAEIRGRVFWFLARDAQDRGNTGEVEHDAAYQKEHLTFLHEAASLCFHPRISHDLACLYLQQKRTLSKAVDHHLIYSVWKYKNRERFDGSESMFTPDTAALELDDVAVSESNTAKIHKVILRHLVGHTDNETRKNVFIPFYYSFWGPLLEEGKCWSFKREATKMLLPAAEEDLGLLWDYAFACHSLNDLKTAQEGYSKVILLDPSQSGAYFNLSLILEHENDLSSALELAIQAENCSPQNAKFTARVRSLRQLRKEHDLAIQQKEDFLRTAPERWSKLDYYKRQVLCALSVITGFNDYAHLAKLTQIDERFIGSHLKKLIELGMVEDEGQQYRVNPHILHLIKQERSHSVVTKIIHAEPTIAFKPIFNSQNEYLIYKILIELFPNQLVFPNMALQAIFQYQRMKELLTAEEFRYYLNAQVDVCITSTANYLPLLGFEIDSIYHDDPSQGLRDERKNNIFKLGGVPLLRIRAWGKPTEAGIKSQLVETMRVVGSQLFANAHQASHFVNLKIEIDFDRFNLPAGLPRAEIPADSES